MGYATGILYRIQLNIYKAYNKGISVKELAQRYEVSELKITDAINKVEERLNNNNTSHWYLDVLHLVQEIKIWRSHYRRKIYIGEWKRIINWF